MKLYLSQDDTPMKFYNFLTVILPISLVIGLYNFGTTLFQYFHIPLFYEYPLFWIDAAFIVFLLGSLLIAVWLLPRMNWRGVQALHCYILLTLLNLTVNRILTYGNPAVQICACLIAGTLINLPIFIYFKKRRLLFFPAPKSKKHAAIPASPSADDVSSAEASPNNSPKKSKQPFFERFDTYVVCPSCGSMVPKSTTHCDCGYDLRSPMQKLSKPLLRFGLLAVLCLCFSLCGFYVGRHSMQDALVQQYDSGYDSGHSAGRASASEHYTGLYELGYRDAMSDIGRAAKKSFNQSVLLSRLVDKYQILRTALKDEYTYSLTLPSLKLPALSLPSLP